MMEKNYLISHMEIADMGYSFADAEQEKEYLESINDDLALKVGAEITRRLPMDKRKYICSLSQEDMAEFLKDQVPDIEETVNSLRELLLKDLKRCSTGYTGGMELDRK